MIGATGVPGPSSRTSLFDSLSQCGISIGVNKEDLRRRVMIPNRLCTAMREAMRLKEATVDMAEPSYVAEEEEPPENPLVVFVNCKSGGRHGPILKGRLQELIGESQVLDLSLVNPSDFVQYGLACLEVLAQSGDSCARITRKNLRIMVAGGDGTVGWLLGCLGELKVQNREPVPPISIIPLGTGNDLSRSFGWGSSFPFAWRHAIKRSLYKAVTGSICHLDSWKVTVAMPAGEEMNLPHNLLELGECTIDQEGDIEGEVPEKTFCFEGVFYNYISIGMDAQVAYGFHNLRDEKPYLAHGPIANKLIYAGYTCSQGWFFTPCISDPSLRGLTNILRISIKKINSNEWEQIPVPPSVRAIVALNLHNYGSGRHPWGNLKPEYLEKRGFVEAQVDDGLLEIFGLKQGWHASLVMVELISAKHIAQAAAIRFEIRGGQWKDAYMQTDGEPWKQPLSSEYSTFVEIKRVPFQSLIVNGDVN
ncbi:Diacylglycerol kinase [Rhynchospora pubera]|uniref:Diacylglycerol kinase n=1 Tax=Rhynchospora pubera TaxID=906938 RepID=A0AAV8HL21_9POAL|nr:Diacylglycerol kinase [Rhynchospora pubera]